MSRADDDMATGDTLAIARLRSRLSDTADVYVAADADASAYFEALREDVLKHRCPPFIVEATVEHPGFETIPVGASVSGWCVARNCAGHWLVYSPETDAFYCFWGTSPDNLGAHGVSGSPLYCWSA